MEYENVAREIVDRVISDWFIAHPERDANTTLYSNSFRDSIATAIQKAVEGEREECAKVAEDCYHGPSDHGCSHGKEIAQDIRSRGKGV